MQAFHLDVVDSTNEQAKRLIAAGEIRGDAYVLAREQSQGKGSRGRSWCSPRDAGIYLSLVRLLDPPVDSTSIELADLTLAAAIGCVEALREAFDLQVRIKPINDLYVADRKLGGILTETVIERGRIQSLIVGIGINTHRAERNFAAPDASMPQGTKRIGSAPIRSALPISVEEALNRPVRAAEVSQSVEAVIHRARDWMSIALAGPSATIRDAFEQYKISGNDVALPSLRHGA